MTHMTFSQNELEAHRQGRGLLDEGVPCGNGLRKQDGILVRTKAQVTPGVTFRQGITFGSSKVRTNPQVRDGEIRRAQADRKRKARKRHSALV